MQRIGVRYLLLVPCLVFFTNPCLADDPATQIDDLANARAMSAKPDAILKVATAAKAPEDADIEMLVEEHVFKLDAEGREHRSSHRIYRYLTDKGVEDWSCTEADWSPWCEERPTIHARVISPDGQEHALDPESIGEAAVEQDTPNLLSDQKLFRAPLPAIQIGAVAEEEIVTQEIRPLFDHGTVERILLADSHPIRKLRLIVDYPTQLPLKYEVLGSDIKPVRTEHDGRVTLRFETGPVPTKELPEAYMPADVCRWPQVVFSTGKSWSDVATIYSTLVESQLDLESVKPLVHEAIGAETDREKIITKLLALVRSRVRYTGVEFGKAAIVPRSSHETLSRRYGDCKDQATLLVAMLRVAGIKANVALLRTGKFTDVDPNLPGLGDFDHAIVFLPGSSPLWIDPTARCVAAGQLPVTDQSRWSMVADSQTTELIRTPRMDHTMNTSSLTYEMFPTSRGKGRVRVRETCTGASDDDLREDYASQTNKELRKAWRDLFKQDYHTQSLVRLDYLLPLDLTKPFHVTAEASDARIGDFGEADATVSLLPDTVFDRLPGIFRGSDTDKEDQDSPSVSQTQSADRQSPLVLPEPHIRDVQFRVTPPPGFAVKALPENSVKQFGPAVLTQKFEKSDDGTIVATFHLDTGSGEFSAAEVNDLRDVIAQLGGKDDQPWEVKIGLVNLAGQHLAAGRVADAVAECRRLLDKHPEQAELHENYSQILLRAGLGEAARAEAEQAVKLAPTSGEAEANLARTLTHDLLGRHFCPGMDLAGATAAYQKALELDPADVTTRIDRAILLEHDAQGLRYSPGTKLDEAIVEYRKAQKRLGPRNRMDQLEVNLALALMYSERYAELAKLASREEVSGTWKALMVVAVAAQEGPNEAKKLSDEMGHDADERRTILETAGEYLQDARLYPQAAAIFEAAEVGASDPTALKNRVTSLKQLHRFNQSELSTDGPRRIVEQLFLAMLAGGKSLDSIPGLFAESSSPHDRDAMLDEFRASMRPLVDNARDSQIPPQRMADVLSILRITSEGDASGYRVQVADDDMKDATFYIVIENGSPRLMPPGPGEANLGTMALRCLEKNDATGAKRWLGWAAEKQAHHPNAAAPFAASPLVNLLQTAGDSPERLRVAAAALFAHSDDPRASIPILLAARKSHSSDADSIQIDRALAHAYLAENDSKEAIEVVDRLLGKSDRPHEALRLKMNALRDLGRTDELRSLLKTQADRTDNDSVTEEIIALEAMRLGDFPTAEKLLRPLSKRAKASSMVFNNLAWNAVAGGLVDKQAIADAKEAVERSSNENPACLHTLAAVYAEMGQTADALENLRRSVQMRGDQATDADWYVLGRIAQRYGLDEVAAGLFRRVPCPKKSAADDAYALAQKRLKKG